MTIRLCVRLIIIIFSICFLFSAPLSTMSVDAEKEREIIFLEDPPKGMVLVAENEALQLYFDFYSTVFEVLDKRTGNVWSGSPAERGDDPIANRRYKGIMSSNILIYYIDEGGEKFLNNYTNSVEFGQFEAGIIENGVRVEYLISDSVLDEVSIPLVLPYSVMHEQILPFLDEKEGREFLSKYEKLTVQGVSKNNIYRMQMVRMYPFIADEDVYAMIGMYSNPLNKVIIKSLLEKAGLETEDIIEINEKYYDHTAIKKNPTFRVFVEITIEDDMLRAETDMAQIEFDNFNAELSSIVLLPYFGAAVKDSNGYILVPDGPGALISLGSNNKEAYSPLILPVYGGTGLLSGAWNSIPRQHVSVPAFGMAYENKGFVGIIESGDAVATIEAGLAGMNTNYSYVNTKFNYNDFYMIDNPMSLTRSPEMSKVPYTGVAGVVYRFLDDDMADYNGMAAKTRSYYERTGVLTEKDLKHNAPLFVQIPGAVTVTKKFLGITYNSHEALTAYIDAEQIIRLLHDNGVDDMNIRLTGWTSGGYNQKYPVGELSNKEMGGQKGLDLLLDSIGEFGYDLYPDIIFTRIYCGIFTAMFKSARDIKGSPWIIYDHNHVIYAPDSDSQKSYLLRYDELIKEIGYLETQLDDIDITNISVADLGYLMYPDYGKDGYNRQEALDMAVLALKDLKNQNRGLSGDHGSIKTAGMFDFITDVAIYSSGHIITDKAVPFYQMIIRGYTGYYPTPVNKQNDPWRHILKGIEYGAAGMSYLLSNSDNTKVWEIGWNDFRNTMYKDRIGEIVSNYALISEFNRVTANHAITEHREIKKDLFMTRYENGAEVYVNYNGYGIEINGMLIEGMSFQVREEQ